MCYADMRETERVLHDVRRIVQEHMIPDAEARSALSGDVYRS
jgi:hypothetical protein